MKKIILGFLLVFISITSYAQGVPQGINYQAIARDTLGNEILNQNLTIKLTVLSNGTNVWEELHSTSTNNYGLFTLVVGQGASTGAGAVAAFSDIDWGGASHSLQVETDDGSGFVNMGVDQLLSVPYALHAPSFFSNMQGGKVDVGPEPGLGIKIVAVTFPTPFANPPNVICTASAQPGTIFDDSFNITVRSVTTTGFEMIVNRVDSYDWGQDLDAFWMAFE
jgi:hypothetical protein